VGAPKAPLGREASNAELNQTAAEWDRERERADQLAADAYDQAFGASSFERAPFWQEDAE
jgi:hypothetical protein